MLWVCSHVEIAVSIIQGDLAIFWGTHVVNAARYGLQIHKPILHGIDNMRAPKYSKIALDNGHGNLNMTAHPQHA
jgi:hypothetical protein